MSKNKLLAAAAVAALSIVATATAAVPSRLSLGPAVKKTKTATYFGYYDGHKDAYLVTDVSSKAQAKAMHINDRVLLATIKAAPPQYFTRDVGYDGTRPCGRRSSPGRCASSA